MAGLGITQVVDILVPQIAGTVGLVVAIFLDLVIALVFIGIGLLARRFHFWAFILGMVIYSLDGLIFLIASEFIGVVIHLFLLYLLFNGVKILYRYRHLKLA